MNEASVTGRKWIYKKFNSKDVDFIKDNFFLDDVTSKLVAIKKISKENIANFLISKFFANNMTFAKVLKITPKSNILFVSIKFKYS